MTEPSTAITVPNPGNNEIAALDEVMLAMDIVDTLRHEQSLVDRELAVEAREANLVERIKKIYAGQGIAVTDELIAKGVEALQQDRFLYASPKPSFALKLAHLYIHRWQWFRRIIITAIVASGAFLVYYLPQQFNANRAYSKYQNQVVDITSRASKIASRIAAIERILAQQNSMPSLVVKPVKRLRAEAETSLQEAKILARQTTRIAVLEHVAFDRNQDSANRSLIDNSNQLDNAELVLSKAETQVQNIDKLQTLATRAVAAMAALGQTRLSTADRKTVRDTSTQAKTSLRAGDASNAEGSVVRLEDIAATILQAYELRVVSRPGTKSGVWRYPVDNPNGRNYYLVVEAIAENGAPLMLPISNEETGKREIVSLFAVRVPESVYENIKSDKQDNGLIDHPLVGMKRRGELAIDYQVDIAGGYITEWED